MDLFRAHAHLEFEEPDLAAIQPACLPLVAAALACGWRLAKDGEPNHTDALHGVKHLQDFRGAKRAQLARLVTFRFVARKRLVEGELIALPDFVKRCQEDKGYLRAAQSLQWYERWLDLLKTAMLENRRSLMTTEPDAHERTLIVPMHGAAATEIHRFAVMYEDSW